MWMILDLVLFAAGYAASIYSWPPIKVWANGAATEVARLRARVTELEARFREI